MRFAFTQDQHALAQGARDLLEGEVTAAHVRAMWEHETGHSPGLWKQLASTGLLAVAVPEEHGGLGLGDVELSLVLEQAGRVALGEPLLETAAIAVPALVEGGTHAQQATWLPRIADGAAIATVHLAHEPVAVAAGVADVLICERDGALHCVPADRFRATPRRSLDGGRRVFTVEAQVGDDTRMDGDPARVFDRAATHTAAVLNGINQHLVEVSTAYAGERTQFDRPIGSFQAVKHMLADMLLESESSRAATWYAAYALASDSDDVAEATSVAKSFASDAERQVNTDALQVHGGIGFTWEHDLHLWLKKGKALEGAYGTAAWHRARIAERLLGR